MALEEHDREDLLRDGRMMPVRGELDLDDVTILIGFRRQGQLSLYSGTQRVFQFDATGQLRRVYFDGRKYAADAGKLLQLSRQSRGGRVELTPQDVDAASTSTIIDAVTDTVKRLSAIISDSQKVWRVVGASNADFGDRVKRWLETIPIPVQIGATPNA